MKIVYFFKSFILKAGMERILSDKMNYLVKEYDYDVTFITYEQGNHPMAFPLDERVKVIDLNVRYFKIFEMNIFKRFIAKYKKLNLLKKKLHDTLNNINPDCVVVSTYDFDKFDTILSLPYRFIVESHICISDIQQEKRQNNLITKYFAKKLDDSHFRKLANAKCLVSLTAADKDNWLNYIKIPIVIIPNMVTNFPNTIYTYNKRPNRILSAGRLTKQKGYDFLLQAWARISKKYPTWRIDIFGHGDMETTLNRMIIDYKLSDCTRINEQSENIYEEYETSSIFVLSSRYEGFALVLIEAMSCGVPCISFDCPNGPAELITHGEDGLLVPLGDIEKLAESIEWMITHEEERLRMSNNARQKARQYTAEVIMPQWVELFEKVAKQ